MTQEEFDIILEYLKSKPQCEWLPTIYRWIRVSEMDEDIFEKLIFNIMVWRNRACS